MSVPTISVLSLLRVEYAVGELPAWWDPEWISIQVIRWPDGRHEVQARAMRLNDAPFEGGTLQEAVVRHLKNAAAILAALSPRLLSVEPTPDK